MLLMLGLQRWIHCPERTNWDGRGSTDHALGRQIQRRYWVAAKGKRKSNKYVDILGFS